MFRIKPGYTTLWRYVLAGAGVLASLAVAGCGGSTAAHTEAGGTAGKSGFYTEGTPGGTPVRGGTVVVDSPEAQVNFDPFVGIGGPPSTQAIYQVFDQLFELLPGSTPSAQPVLKPALVSSWTESPNHLVYTFHLRPGVRFSNGEAMSSEDVVFSLKKAMSPLDSYATGYVKYWKGIEALSPSTVRLRLSRPEPTLLEAFDGYPMSIVPKKVFERDGVKEFRLHPIGTGAFVVRSVSAGFTSVRIGRNPYYWRAGQPYLNEVVYNQVESDNARILAVRSGAANVAVAVPYAQVATLEKTPGVRMLVAPEWGGSFNPFNKAKAPFNEVNVRKALLYATPREEIIKAVYRGIGQPSNSYLGVLLKYWTSKVPLYPYDLTKARELLKDSSVPHGFETTIEVGSGESTGELMASILQSSWAQIGVHANIHTVSPTAVLANFFAGKYEFDVLPPEDGYSNLYAPDATALVEIANKEPGFGPPASAEVLAKIDEAITSPDEKLREKLFQEVQYDAYWKEAISMPIVSLVSLNLASDSLHGFQQLPSTYFRMEKTWLQK